MACQTAFCVDVVAVCSAFDIEKLLFICRVMVVDVTIFRQTAYIRNRTLFVNSKTVQLFPHFVYRFQCVSISFCDYLSFKFCSLFFASSRCSRMWHSKFLMFFFFIFQFLLNIFSVLFWNIVLSDGLVLILIYGFTFKLLHFLVG